MTNASFDAKVFSVVIPAYNNLALFQDALHSVLRQENVNVEIIVADDSEDHEIENFVLSTAQRLSAHDDECSSGISPRFTLRHSRSESPKGAVHNWNRGLALAKGDYVLLLHHDERLVGTNLLAAIEQQLARTEAVVADVNVTTSNGAHYRLAPKLLKKFFIRFPLLLYMTNVIGPCACVAFRRELLKPFDERMRWLVDVDWYYQILAGHSRGYMPQCCIHSIHGHSEQLTSRLNIQQENDRDLTLLREKYRKNIGIRCCLWVYQNILHNKNVNALLKKSINR